MRYVESAAFFCATAETVKECTLDTLSTRHNALPHHLKDLLDTNTPRTSAEDAESTLEADRNWEALSLHVRATSLAPVEVYIDEFIRIVQGGPTEQRQITRHLFRAINDLFQPYNKYDNAKEEPIYLKKICKVDAAWSMQKVVLGCSIDTVK